MYSYRQSLKSSRSDELVNTYLLRPLAGVIVRALYPTPITPNQVTVAATLAGLAAAVFYTKGTPGALVTAGLLVTLKDLLDSADGQLARARRQYSRIGRFLDSIGDFIVNAAVFGAMGWMLFQATNDFQYPFMSLLGLIGISLRVSYHVFYQVNFLHLEKMYTGNRVTEEVRAEDLGESRVTLILQKTFQILYGWQDRLMARIDRWSCAGEPLAHERRRRWYGDLTALRLSGFLGFGTEYLLLTVCSLFLAIETYLWLNLFLMNGILITCILYRRWVLRPRLQVSP